MIPFIKMTDFLANGYVICQYAPFEWGPFWLKITTSSKQNSVSCACHVWKNTQSCTEWQFNQIPFPKIGNSILLWIKVGQGGQADFFPCSQSQGICQIATQNSCVHTHTVTFLALANCCCRHRQKSRTDFQVANGSWGAMPRSCKSSSGEEKSIIPALTPNRSGNFQLYCTCETRNPEWETSVGDKCGRQV